MGSRLTTAVFAIVHREPARAPPPVDRLGAGSGSEATTHGGSLNRSTLCVSEKTCDESNHETEPPEIRCLVMGENVTPRGLPFGDGHVRSRGPGGFNAHSPSARLSARRPERDQLEGGAGTELPSATVNPSFRLSALDGVARTVEPLAATITMSYRVAPLDAA